MDETIPYQPNGSEGDPTAPESPIRAQHRYTFSSGARPLEGYTIKRAIGRGGFGEVYYATSDAGKEVALKLITRNLEVERRGVMQCMNLKNSHLITIHDLRSNDEGDTFVIMEYVSGPSLASILQKHPSGLPLTEVRLWLKQLVDGVAYLHDHGIVHRDLKPANLFMEEGVVKIGDYGLSKAITNSREPGHSESVGTCHYMAPEISTGKYHQPIDIYAIGVILYEMITGRVPFDGESVGEVLMKHLTSRPDLSPLPDPYKSIVARALAKDPNHRPARVTDLLLPGDTPREPEVRFIGDNKSGLLLPTGAAQAAAPPPVEEVLHIGTEEPVFYIGPDTRPPRTRRASIQQWLRNACPKRQAARIQPVAQNNHRRPSPAPMPPPPAPRRPVATAVNRPRPSPVPEPPPAEPPIPSTRMKVAELSTSMLLAAPLAGLASLFSVPMFEVFGDWHPQHPAELALLFAMTLLGSWGVMIPSKIWEGHVVSAGAKRLVMMVVGLLVGTLGAGLAYWAHLGLPPGGWSETPFSREFTSSLQPVVQPQMVLPIALATYFAVAFGLNRYWKVVARDRKARFRIFPVVAACVIGGLVGSFWPVPQPWGMIVVTIVPIVAQFSSPWDKQAAAYARYAEALGRAKAS